ncbi:MAG: hypothetical protein E7174_05135 [Firmicutes bacterium]|nr:hypothetical protein [Bacillota bacterium]
MNQRQNGFNTQDINSQSNNQSLNSNPVVNYNRQTGQPIYENQNSQTLNNNQNTQSFAQNQQVNSNVQNSVQAINPQTNYNVSNNYTQPNYQPMNNTNKNSSFKRNKKNVIFGLIGIVVISLIIGIIILFGGNNKSISRTIMIYMVGADLESKNGLATVDLDSINYNSMDNENINVVLIAGGATKWHNNYINSNETSIYELKTNGFQKVQQQSTQNMGAPQTLSNFLNYVYNNYKTDEYDLIFWNHGAAILGSEQDELTDDILTLSEFKVAFSNSTLGGEKRLETISFRTCLNGTIEVASSLKDYAEYLIASEEVTRGYPLGNVLSFINNIEKSDTAIDYGKKFINAYKEQMSGLKSLYNSSGETYDIYSTYSVVDLSKIEELETSVNDMFEDVDINSNYNTIAKVRSNLYQYGDSGPYDMVDLYNLIDGIKDISPNKAKKVLKNIENAVVYNWATNSQSRGLSIYFPFKATTEYKNAFLQLYNTFPNIKQYNNFISNFSSIQSSSYKDFSFASNKTDLKSNQESSDFSLELTDEQKEGFAKANYIVFRDNKNGNYLPVYKGNEVSLKGNTLSANIKNKQLKIIATDDKTENIITLFEDEITDKYIKYDTIVTLEDFSSEKIGDWKMETATISLIYNKETKKTTIANVSLNSNNEKLPGGVVSVDLNDYTNIVFASSSYKIQDENGNYNENWESNGVIEGIEVNVGKFEFEQQNFDDGYDYYCVFRIYDVDNNYYYSKLVKMN